MTPADENFDRARILDVGDSVHRDVCPHLTLEIVLAGPTWSQAKRRDLWLVTCSLCAVKIWGVSQPTTEEARVWVTRAVDALRLDAEAYPHANATSSVEDAEPAGKPIAASEKSAVDHPPHYTAHPSGVEAIVICEHFNFNVGNAIKYCWRAGLKTQSAIEDLEKARWCLAREVERLKKAESK